MKKEKLSKKKAAIIAAKQRAKIVRAAVREAGIVEGELFRKSYKRIRKKFDVDDEFQTDESALALLKAFLSSTIALIPAAEDNALRYPGQSSIYALQALVNQSRELLNDIRGLQSSGLKQEELREKVYEPFVRLMVEWFAMELFNMKSQLHTIAPKKSKAINERLDKLLYSFGAYLKESKNKMLATTAEIYGDD